jgi:hypothetical protein
MENYKEVMLGMVKAKEKFEELKKEFGKDLQSNFTNICKWLLDTVSGVNVVYWTQYTPYFNDGDPCTFRVTEPFFTNATVDQIKTCSYIEDLPSESEEMGLWVECSMCPEFYNDTSFNHFRDEYKKIFSEEDNKVLHTFSKFVQDNEEFLEPMFGDSHQVFVTRDGIYTEYYDHD